MPQSPDRVLENKGEQPKSPDKQKSLFELIAEDAQKKAAAAMRAPAEQHGPFGPAVPGTRPGGKFQAPDRIFDQQEPSGEELLDMDIKHATANAQWDLGSEGVTGKTGAITVQGASGKQWIIPPSGEDAVLAMQYRPGDNAYNAALDRAKTEINKQRDARLATARPTGREEDSDEQRALTRQAELDRREKYVYEHNKIPVFKGEDGKILEGWGNTEEYVDVSQQALQTGEYVYIGTDTTMFAGTTPGFERPQYWHISQAEGMLFGPDVTPAQIAAFQDQQGLKVTGVVDENTAKRWKNILESAARYARWGQQVDLMLVAQAYGKAEKDSGGGGYRRYGGGGGGYGGGGGGGAAVPADAAKGLLNRTMQDVLGREATDAEQAAFLIAIRGAALGVDFDANQFTLSWVRGQKPGEAGSFQAATDFYQVLMSTLAGG